MDDEAPLDYMLDHPTLAVAGREELQAIVARSGRRRTRIMAAGLAVTLVVGGAGGWAVAGGGSSGTSVAVAHSDTSTTSAPPFLSGGVGGSPTAGAALAGPYATSLTKQFVRTTPDGVMIRGYQQKSPPNLPEPLASCGFAFSGFQAEVSTAEIAGQAGGGFRTQTGPGPLESVQSVTLGVAEGAPVWVVTTKTAAAVAQVRVRFTDGKTDQMAPVAGYAVLAHLAAVEKPPAAPGPALPSGTVDALDAAGKVIATKSLLEAIGVPKSVPIPSVNATGGSSSAGAGPLVTATGPLATASSSVVTATTIPASPATAAGAVTRIPATAPAEKPGAVCPVPTPLLPPGAAGATGILTPGQPAPTTTIQAAGK